MRLRKAREAHFPQSWSMSVLSRKMAEFLSTFVCGASMSRPATIRRTSPWRLLKRRNTII